MKLLDEIIAALSEPHPSVTDALMKTKVLLHKLGRKDLMEWVDNEINGYSEDAPLPKYRVIAGHVKGNVTNNHYSYTDHPLPTLHLDKEVRERYEKMEMHQSIAVLEALAKKDEKGLQCPLPIESGALFNKALSNGYRVQQAWCDIGVGSMSQIIAQVRSKLLDFLLELKEKVGDQMSEEEVKRIAQSPETGAMFNNAIFGDNVTFVIGHGNQQTVNNRLSKKGDFRTLSEYLRAKNVSEEDISSLEQAVAQDAQAPEIEEKSFGPRVKHWLSAMLNKAVNATWQVELGIASALLTDALKAYYGW